MSKTEDLLNTDCNEIDSKFSHIQNSNKPDRHYEYFWLTFKNVVYRYATISQKKQILQLSATLNELQKNRKYDEIKTLISKFMNDHINTIITNHIISQDMGRLCHLRTNINRWAKIDEDFYCDGALYDFLVAVKNGNEKKKGDRLIKGIELFSCYLKSNSNQDIINFVNHSIKENLQGFVAVGAHYVDITLFAKDGCKKTPHQLTGMTCKKLVRFIEPKPDLKLP